MSALRNKIMRKLKGILLRMKFAFTVLFNGLNDSYIIIKISEKNLNRLMLAQSLDCDGITYIGMQEIHFFNLIQGIADSVTDEEYVEAERRFEKILFDNGLSYDLISNKSKTKIKAYTKNELLDKMSMN